MAKAIVRAADLRQQVYDNLRQRITKGEFGPEVRFYERTFADELGVSRTPVREALAMLESDGLLVQAARGYRLTRMTREQVMNTTEIRMLLEPHAMAVLVDRAGAEQLAKMAERIRTTVATTRDSDAYIESHRKLREMLFSKLENRLLADAIQQYEDSIHFVRISTLQDGRWRGQSAEGMLRLADAMEAGDAQAAARSQSDLLAQARDAFLAFSQSAD